MYTYSCMYAIYIDITFYYIIIQKPIYYIWVHRYDFYKQRTISLYFNVGCTVRSCLLPTCYKYYTNQCLHVHRNHECQKMCSSTLLTSSIPSSRTNTNYTQRKKRAGNNCECMHTCISLCPARNLYPTQPTV